jgi:hypothetical protein
MTLPAPGFRLVVGCLLLPALFACREESLTHEQIVRDDLSEIMALQEVPCGEVASFESEGHLDYRIECENGYSYRIHVSVEGHVKVNSHDAE